VASQLIPDCQATLDALQELDCVGDSRPVGYYGLSQGGEMGIRLGSHYRVPSFEIDSSVRFFARHLGTTSSS
jgi:dienelactone hydrolase